MAITFDTSVDTSYNVSVSSLTFSHTTSGTERLLVVNAGLWTNSGKTVTGVTYNGTAMTLVDNGAADANNNCYMYYLINPDSGTHDVVISASGTCDLWGASASYNGVNQLAPLGDTNKSNGSGDPLTGTVTTTEANSWIIMVNYGNGGGDGQTAGAGTTLRENNTATGAVIADSSGAVSPGSNSLITNGLAGVWIQITAEFYPAGAATSVKDIIGQGFIPFAR